jgi:hypothetical protein
MIDGIDTVSVLTARESVPDVPDKGFERFLLMQDDTLYIFKYQDTIEKFDTRASQATLNHIVNTIRFMDSDSDLDFNGTSDDENENDDNSSDENN